MNNSASRFVLAVACLAACACAARADDWPQWLGPRRDGVWREQGTLDAIPREAASKLAVRWRASVNGGYAGPAVAGGRVFVTDFKSDAGDTVGGRGTRPGVERVLCLDEATGKPLWEHTYRVTYSLDYGSGPRATPTVDEGRVYTLGAEGHLTCLDVVTGKPVWSKHFATDFGAGAATPVWGFASHPLVDGDLLITLTGPAPAGKLVTAFDKRTGEVRWTALKDKEIGYAPPVIIEVGGTRQLVIFHPEAVSSLDPATGKVYWTQAFGPVRYGVSITTPTHVKHPQLGDLLVVSSYWDGSLALKLDAAAPKVSVLWRREGRGRADQGALHSLMAAPATTPTHLYGMSKGGELRCLDLASGDVLWETYAATTGDEGHQDNATAFLVPTPTPAKTFLFNESGEVILAKLTPAGYEELGRQKVLEPTNRASGRAVLWSHPALANRCAYWRNDQEIVCISLTAGAK